MSIWQLMLAVAWRAWRNARRTGILDAFFGMLALHALVAMRTLAIVAMRTLAVRTRIRRTIVTDAIHT